MLNGIPTIKLPPEALAAHQAAQLRFRELRNAAGAGGPARDDDQALSIEELEDMLARQRKVKSAIRADAAAENRAPTEREERRLQECDEVTAAAEVELEARGERPAETARHAVRNVAGTEPASLGRKTTAEPSDSPSGRLERTETEWRDRAGTRVVCLAPDQPLRATVRPAVRNSIAGQKIAPGVGEVLRSVITGDWSRIGETKNALSEGAGDSSGAVFILPEIAATLIDLARAKSVVFQAGAKTIVMHTNELDLVQLTGDVTPGWTAELATIPLSDPAFGRLQMIARKLAVRVKISRELCEDAPNSAAMIEGIISAAMASEIDRVALFGSGTAPEPRGVANTSGINAVAAGGALTYDMLLAAIGAIEGANLMPNAWITSPHNKQLLATQKETTGLYLAPPPDVDALKKLVSAKMPNSTALVGDFSQLLIGVRLGGVQFETSTQADDAFSNDAVYVKARWRGGVAVLHPAAFTKITGIA